MSRLREKTALLIVIVLCTTFAATSMLRAEVAAIEARSTAEIDALQDPNATETTPVYAVLEANGRFYVGGNFTTVAGETQAYLAALDVATGQIDPVFNPIVVSDDLDVERRGVKALAISPDGNHLFVGGYFDSINGEPRSRIAKVDATTGAVDLSFNPGASALVESIETDGTSVWVGGVFDTLGGVTSPHLGKLDAVSGAIDPAWATHVDTTVHDIHIVDSTLYVAGNFTKIGPFEVGNDGSPTFDNALTVDRVARASLSTGTVVADANGVDAAWNPAAEHRVYEIDAHPDGSLIYLAGAGPKVDGGNSLRAIDATTGDEAWRRVNAGDYQAIAVTSSAVYGGTHGNYVFSDPDGELCEGEGCFEESPGVFVDNPNATRRDKLSAYDPMTGDLLAWSPAANSTWGVWAMEIGPSGLLVGGDFTQIDDVHQSHFALFEGDGWGNPAPTPAFTSTCVEALCDFDAGESTDDGTIVGYLWNFGNGLTSTDANPTGVPLTTGQLNTVSLTLTDDLGAHNTLTQQVDVGVVTSNSPFVVGAFAAVANSTHVTVTVPLEAQVGDLAIAFVTVPDVGVSVTTPDGWGLIGELTGTQMQSHVYTKPIGPGQTGTAATFIMGEQRKTNVIIAAVRGVDPNNPLLTIDSTVETVTRAAHGAPALAFTGEATVLRYWADKTSATTTITPPLNNDELASATTTGSGRTTATLSVENESQLNGTGVAVGIADSPKADALGWSIALQAGSPPEPLNIELTPADGTVERVVHLSLDGLASGYVNETNTPNLVRLINEGTSTLNARTDGDFTKTMPNHFSQLSGRPVLGDGGHNITFNQWDPDVDTNTVHDEAGEYVSSVFDVVHDHGLRTAGFVSKDKLDMVDLSWSMHGAPDETGEDNGTDKIDVWDRDSPVELMSSVIGELATNGPEFTFVQLRSPDEAGHAFHWGSDEYLAGVSETDALVGQLIAAIAASEDLAGTTALIVTADHGGPAGGNFHNDHTDADNFTIPFIYWGPTIGMGVDMYVDEIGVRLNPGIALVANAGGEATEPIRGHDAGNLALELLGLPPIPGSDYHLGAEFPLCNGLAITVDLSAGELPTVGDDVILGTAGADVILASAGDDTICGLGGDDTINAGPGNDWVDAGSDNDTVFGLAGNDTLIGGDGADTVVGLDGDDQIFGGPGNDTLNGGVGDDTITGEDGEDDIFGLDGNDTLDGEGGNDLISGSDGIDIISGGDGADVLNGGPDNDTIDGNAGDDTIFGLTGDDLLDGGSGDDVVFGQLGADMVNGGLGDDWLFGNEDDDTITDPAGNNTVNGGPGSDQIIGGSGDDTIFGDGNLAQAGNDMIDGGLGADLLLGFAGQDTIVADDGVADTVNGGPDIDTCTTDAADTVFNCNP